MTKGKRTRAAAGDVPRRKRRRASTGKSVPTAAGERTPRSFHYHVYVVELASDVMYESRFRKSNPDYAPGKPCVYVGMTGLEPEERFANHQRGIKAAWAVKQYGIRLLPEFYAHLNPMPFEAAVQMEVDLAEDLRAQGYTVTGGH